MTSKNQPQWIPIDKPAGFTSHDIVAIARRSLGLKKIGHSGTLDPDATGVLVLAISKATRLISYLGKDKAYLATIKLGQQTDTLDAAGEIVDEQEVPDLTEEQIRTHLDSFLGEQLQLPPMVSAISYKGKRLYQLARQGVKEVPVPPRSVTIFELKLLSVDLPNITVHVNCSGGTYIRSLAADLGQKIGCGAHLSSLRRTLSNGFKIEDCFTLEQLKAWEEPHFSVEYPIKEQLPSLSLCENEAMRISQGQRLDRQGPESTIIQLYNPQQNLIGLGEYQHDYLKAKLILV